MYDEHELGRAWEETGEAPNPDVFSAWWSQDYQSRLRGELERRRTFRQWVQENPDEVRRVRKSRALPLITDDLIEAGFARQIYGKEVVWFRIEVDIDPERLDRPPAPRAVMMAGRPTRAERRRWRRVTAEQAERARIADEQRRLAAQERERQRIEAVERARALLLSNLDPVQRAEYEDTGQFHVHVQTKDGEHVYRISDGQAGNVARVEGTRITCRYCIHPYGGGEPNEDVMLAQKLMLETDEQRFLQVANASGRWI